MQDNLPVCLKMIRLHAQVIVEKPMNTWKVEKNCKRTQLRAEDYKHFIDTWFNLKYNYFMEYRWRNWAGVQL